MKITNKTKNRIYTIRELELTDVFSYEGELFMLVDSVCHPTGTINAMSLETGICTYLDPNLTVYKLDAELILY